MTTTAVDTDILAKLDFDADVPCEWTAADGHDCDQAAEWQITCVIGRHFRQHLFTCTPHKEHVVNHGTNCCAQWFTIESAVRIS